jgi:CheY-like chemotaxis protein
MRATLTVLFAEDDEGHAALVRRNFARGGLDAHAVHVHDGQELLDYLYRRDAWRQRQHHDALVVLLDLNMPRLGGLEVLDRMKADPRLAHIPVFVLTTTDNPAELNRCYDRGASACLVKPVDYGAFSDLVRRLAELLAVANPPAEVIRQAS